METELAAKTKRPGLVRRLYDWTISWAERPGGTWALFLLALAESSFFPIPPDVLLIALCVGASTKSFRFALVCSIGSVLGGALGYAIGMYGYEAIGEPIVNLYHGQAILGKIQVWYDKYGFWGTLAAAITPIPYKVFTIASGMFKFPFWPFMAASIIGRSFRFFVVAGIIYVYGPKVKTYIEKYFDLLAWLLLFLAIGGFIALNFFSGAN